MWAWEKICKNYGKPVQIEKFAREDGNIKEA